MNGAKQAYDWYKQQEARNLEQAATEAQYSWSKGFAEGLALAYKHAAEMLDSIFPDQRLSTSALSQESAPLVASQTQESC